MGRLPRGDNDPVGAKVADEVGVYRGVQAHIDSGVFQPVRHIEQIDGQIVLERRE